MSSGGADADGVRGNAGAHAVRVAPASRGVRRRGMEGDDPQDRQDDCDLRMYPAPVPPPRTGGRKWEHLRPKFLQTLLTSGPSGPASLDRSTPSCVDAASTPAIGRTCARALPFLHLRHGPPAGSRHRFGYDWPDSVAGANLSRAFNSPVLLTDFASLHPAVSAYVAATRALRPTARQGWVLGGPG
jgi:hypothetical protein